ncbi:MAG: hypothetical protein AB7S81_00695 [Bdellovibrionales bacterium]
MVKGFSVFVVMTCLSLAVPAWASVFASGATPTIKEKAPHTLFARAIEDLPVMSGLEVVDDEDVLEIFGSQRMAQTLLRGRVDIDRVYYFYAEVLPSLGWKKIDSKTYRRETERLLFQPSSANEEGMTYVRFVVEPMGEGGAE